MHRDLMSTVKESGYPLTTHGPGIEGTLGSFEKRPHNIANLPKALCNFMLGKWELTSFQDAGSQLTPVPIKPKVPRL